MKRVCVVCEGQTEEEFVLNVLAPAFYPLGINLIPEMIHTSPGCVALIAARNAAISPEHINDHPETKPAAHLERALKNPQYRKRRHGPIAAQKIGLNKIEAECAFFAGWMAQLRRLA